MGVDGDVCTPVEHGILYGFGEKSLASELGEGAELPVSLGADQHQFHTVTELGQLGLHKLGLSQGEVASSGGEPDRSAAHPSLSPVSSRKVLAASRPCSRATARRPLMGTWANL